MMPPAGMSEIDDANAKHLVGMQDLLLGIASKYINIPLHLVNDALNQSLQEMGQFVHADRVYVFSYDLAKNTARNTHEWCAEGIEPQIEYLQELSLAHVPQWVDAHSQNKPFEVTDTLALPDDGPGGLRDILVPQGIKSLLTVPMWHDGVILGTVGFDAVRQKYAFNDQEKVLLKLFADMLVNIQLRKQTDMQKEAYLEKIERQNRQLKEYAFVVSHRIRSHSSNLEGLLHLMAIDRPEIANDPSFQMLNKTSAELDDTLREITGVITAN